jgi:acetylornithine deacetylase
MIEGGTAVNVLARDARVTWEYRALPDRDPDVIVERAQNYVNEAILPKYKQRVPEARIETKVHARYPGLVLDADSPAIALAREISGANRIETVAYGTEAGLFQRAGIPVVVCGPGSIEQAHKADEFVALSELEACGKFLRNVIRKATT